MYLSSEDPMLMLSQVLVLQSESRKGIPSRPTFFFHRVNRDKGW